MLVLTLVQNGVQPKGSDPSQDSERDVFAYVEYGLLAIWFVFTVAVLARPF
jgi:hypothetical protein